MNRKNTFYGLSHNRIIIKSGVRNIKISSYYLSDLQNLSVTEKADGTGTILLGKDKQGSKMYRGTYWPGSKLMLAPALELIPEAAKVLKVIKALQKAG
jgi:hypothetical protein